MSEAQTPGGPAQDAAVYLTRKARAEPLVRQGARTISRYSRQGAYHEESHSRLCQR
jgi:hypothetical protein